MKDNLKALDYSVLQQCMHCGMCLPTCPTYVETKRERNSPRGRIALMRSIADGELAVSKSFGDEMYYCLGCLACQTACPAGVNYTELFETARAHVERTEVLKTPERSFWRWLTLQTLFMNPRVLKLVGLGLRFYQKTGLQDKVRASGLLNLLPDHLKRLEPQTPIVADKFSSDLIDEWEFPSEGTRYKVALLTGCVQDLVFSQINRDTADVLLANGCAVYTPANQFCCGSLHGHNGELLMAKELAIRQFETFDLEELDAIITNAGGCGSHLKHYAQLFDPSDPLHAVASKWDSKVKDIHEWLVEIGFKVPDEIRESEKVTYHESCHLCHGQKVTEAPRKILRALLGSSYVELKDSNVCCGSAGIYNITQPEQSEKLLRNKVTSILASDAGKVVTSNPGCHLQLERGLRDHKACSGSCSGQGCSKGVEVSQPVTLLAEAYRRADLKNA